MIDRNRDWKPIAALVLAGLALFIALSGRWSISMSGGTANQEVQAFSVGAPSFAQPQPTVVPPKPAQGFMQDVPGAPDLKMQPPAIEQHFWQGPQHEYWGPFGGAAGGRLFRGVFFGLFALLLIFIGLKLLRRNRFRPWGQTWGPPGPPPPGYPPQGYPPAGAPWQGYPPQGYQGYGYGPPYQGAPQPPPPPAQPEQGQQGPFQNGDITRPEGSE
jgi:hypothetical protein